MKKNLGMNAISEFQRRCKIEGTVETQRAALRTVKKREQSDEWAMKMNRECNKNIGWKVLRAVWKNNLINFHFQ